MTDRTISPLRRRMIEDMTVRGFAPATQTGYIRAVRDFTAFFGRSPDPARAADLRRHQLRMRSIGASATSLKYEAALSVAYGAAPRARRRARSRARRHDAAHQSPTPDCCSAVPPVFDRRCRHTAQRPIGPASRTPFPHARGLTRPRLGRPAVPAAGSCRRNSASGAHRSTTAVATIPIAHRPSAGPRFPPPRLVRHLPNEPVADAQPRRVSDNP